MAEIKANSTVGGAPIANISLDGVSKSNFTTAQLAQIKGTAGNNGSIADDYTWSVSGTTLTISGSGGSIYSLAGSTLNITVT